MSCDMWDVGWVGERRGMSGPMRRSVTGGRHRHCSHHSMGLGYALRIDPHHVADVT